jgi:hypothetical protein
MSKKLKRFIANLAITMLGFGCAIFAYEKIGPLFADKYYTLIHLGLYLVAALVAGGFAWHAYDRFRNGDCFVDD